jgi:hypothetical protein
MRCAEGGTGSAACRAVVRAGLALANGGRNAGVLSCSLDLYAGLYRAGRGGTSPDGRRFWSSV